MTISTDTSSSMAATWLDGLEQSTSRTRALRKVARIASVCLAIYWLLIFAGTHLPAASLPHFTAWDKLCHAGAFAGLAFLLAWALPSWGGSLAHVSIAAVIALGYGCVDELSQTLIPGRSCDLADFVADAVGVLIGLTSYMILRGLLSQFGWGRRLLRGLSR